MVSSDKDHHDHRSQRCNSYRGNGMCVKNLQKLDIRSDNGDQVTLVTAFQLCRTKFSQSRKYLMTYDRQKLKGDKMIAILFHIMKDTTKHRNKDHHCKDPVHRNSGKPGTLHCCFRDHGDPCTCIISCQTMKNHLTCQDRQENST